MTAVLVRAQQPQDAQAVREVLVAAFGDERVAELAAALQSRADATPALVALLDGVPVGHVQLSRGWVDAVAQLVAFARRKHIRGGIAGQ